MTSFGMIIMSTFLPNKALSNHAPKRGHILWYFYRRISFNETLNYSIPDLHIQTLQTKYFGCKIYHLSFSPQNNLSLLHKDNTLMENLSFIWYLNVNCMVCFNMLCWKKTFFNCFFAICFTFSQYFAKLWTFVNYSASFIFHCKDVWKEITL